MMNEEAQTPEAERSPSLMEGRENEPREMSIPRSRSFQRKLAVLISRLALFLLSLALSFALAVAALALCGVAVLLYISGKDLPFSQRTLPYYPEGWAPMEIPLWSAPVYLGVGLALLFIGLPLVLALLEKFWLQIGSDSFPQTSQSA
jgi:hypothetical protein